MSIVNIHNEKLKNIKKQKTLKAKSTFKCSKCKKHPYGWINIVKNGKLKSVRCGNCFAKSKKVFDY